MGGNERYEWSLPMKFEGRYFSSVNRAVEMTVRPEPPENPEEEELEDYDRRTYRERWMDY